MIKVLKDTDLREQSIVKFESVMFRFTIFDIKFEFRVCCVSLSVYFVVFLCYCRVCNIKYECALCSV